MAQRLPERQVDVPGGTPDGYVLTTTSEKAGWGEAPGGGGGPRSAVFKFFEPLEAGVGATLLPNDDGADRTILSVRALCEVAPDGGDEVIDVNIDGTTIYTDQDNRPAIADGTTNSGKNTDADVTTWPDGSVLSCDVDTHVAPCAQLQVMVVYQ